MPDGKIVGGGLYDPFDKSKFLLIRYNTNGTVDSNFGTNGIYATTIFNNSGINSLIQLQNGKLLGAGFKNNGTNTVFTLARYTDLDLVTNSFENTTQAIFAHPNPFYDSITFEYQLENVDIVNIELVDLQGRVLHTILKNQLFPMGKYCQVIKNLSSLETGNYLLHYSTSKLSKTIKIIKKN
jgi:hypothetical protein